MGYCVDFYWLFVLVFRQSGGDDIIEGEESGLIQSLADFLILKFRGTMFFEND